MTNTCAKSWQSFSVSRLFAGMSGSVVVYFTMPQPVSISSIVSTSRLSRPAVTRSLRVITRSSLNFGTLISGIGARGTAGSFLSAYFCITFCSS